MKIHLQKIADPFILSSKVNLFILRLDKTHAYISGNKWYKLKYNLEEAKKQKRDTLLTFGGAYSNHIAATAAAGKEFGFKTIGVIRGDELGATKKEKNATLRSAESCGMKFHFVSREEYRKKDSQKFIDLLTQVYGDFYLLPEGGTNELAVKGCSEITSLITIPFNYICCPVGTAGTIAGIISSLQENQKALGFSVLKANGFHEQEIEKWLLHFQINSFSNLSAGRQLFQIEESYHFGGYAKQTPELLNFISDFEKQHRIRLDPVYTGKMIFGIYDRIGKNIFPKGSTVIAVHTGGLQGRST
jgi:1-aminocyclopropane-1-carboxylate deaminase